ncbi:hypothetical protein EYF80_019346 [Liparis tanakae]|uniref:Uncharacterized protein n=1 Tax=Liparis tanakae TaxID=230148 RepID=A0A4Z2HXA0_9TELE|nr:hypothetical protein EYF80_019346 [Liparis tanakae]
MPSRKTSSEKKSAAIRFLWMAWRLERSRRKRHSKMKVRRRRQRETDTVVRVYSKVMGGSRRGGRGGPSLCTVALTMAVLITGRLGSLERHGKVVTFREELPHRFVHNHYGNRQRSSRLDVAPAPLGRRVLLLLRGIGLTLRRGAIPTSVALTAEVELGELDG